MFGQQASSRTVWLSLTSQGGLGFTQTADIATIAATLMPCRWSKQLQENLMNLAGQADKSAAGQQSQTAAAVAAAQPSAAPAGVAGVAVAAQPTASTGSSVSYKP